MNDNIATYLTPSPEAEVDAVILVIPIGTSQSPPLLKKLADNITTILHYGIRPVIVVNFVNSVKSEEEINKSFEIIYKESHLNKPDLFMLDNYENEVYRNMDKDLIYMKILSVSFDRACLSMRKNPPLPPKAESRPGPSIVRRDPDRTDKACQTPSCSNNGKSVSTPVCPQCGKPPQVPSERTCVQPGCRNNGKAVDTPLCGFCGRPPQIKSVARCQIVGCSNFRNEVTTPFCPTCGNPPVQASAPPAISSRVCSNPECPSYGQPVPKDYPRCGNCGTLVGSVSQKEPQKPKTRKCANHSCSHYNDPVLPDFSLCPYCGYEPSFS